jgi:hypothetical protein
MNATRHNVTNCYAPKTLLGRDAHLTATQAASKRKH